ncbi:MAG: type II 3-dehydroquinate dehydratase [Bacteroidota bacterium]|nr:type II 3-dehydroquinate dehydratase [Bacteroidota bacterium]
MTIIIINGPNLNLLGKREKSHYGDISFDEYFEGLKSRNKSVNIEYFQSNVEGEIINKLHETGFDYDGIILNAGGYTHTSVAIGDAVRAIETPVVEVHISNIFSREKYRHESFIAPAAAGTISGFGINAYDLAIDYIVNFSKNV